MAWPLAAVSLVDHAPVDTTTRSADRRQGRWPGSLDVLTQPSQVAIHAQRVTPIASTLVLSVQGRQLRRVDSCHHGGSRGHRDRTEARFAYEFVDATRVAELTGGGRGVERGRGTVGSCTGGQMGEAVVSMTRITMGRLLLRRMPAEELAKLAQPQAAPSLAHWTLRCPSGCVIIDVHPNREAWAEDFARSDAMFRDPIFRFSADAFSFIDDEHEASTINLLEKGQRATAGYSALAAPPGPLQGRLVSFNYVPRLPETLRADVWRALSNHQFASVLQLALRSDSGDLLVDAYLNENQLIDDFVAVEAVLSDAGHPVTNEWYPFTDRPHERALDQLAFALGALDQPPE